MQDPDETELLPRWEQLPGDLLVMAYENPGPGKRSPILRLVCKYWRHAFDSSVRRLRCKNRPPAPAALMKFPSLTSLDLSSCTFDQSGPNSLASYLEALQQLPSLREVTLNYNAMMGAAINSPSDNNLWGAVQLHGGLLDKLACLRAVVMIYNTQLRACYFRARAQIKAGARGLGVGMGAGRSREGGMAGGSLADGARLGNARSLANEGVVVIGGDVENGGGVGNRTGVVSTGEVGNGEVVVNRGVVSRGAMENRGGGANEEGLANGCFAATGGVGDDKSVADGAGMIEGGASSETGRAMVGGVASTGCGSDDGFAGTFNNQIMVSGRSLAHQEAAAIIKQQTKTAPGLHAANQEGGLVPTCFNLTAGHAYLPELRDPMTTRSSGGQDALAGCGGTGVTPENSTTVLQHGADSSGTECSGVERSGTEWGGSGSKSTLSMNGRSPSNSRTGGEDVGSSCKGKLSSTAKSISRCVTSCGAMGGASTSSVTTNNSSSSTYRGRASSGNNASDHRLAGGDSASKDMDVHYSTMPGQSISGNGSSDGVDSSDTSTDCGSKSGASSTSNGYYRAATGDNCLSTGEFSCATGSLNDSIDASIGGGNKCVSRGSTGNSAPGASLDILAQLVSNGVRTSRSGSTSSSGVTRGSGSTSSATKSSRGGRNIGVPDDHATCEAGANYTSTTSNIRDTSRTSSDGDTSSTSNSGDTSGGSSVSNEASPSVHPHSCKGSSGEPAGATDIENESSPLICQLETTSTYIAQGRQPHPAAPPAPPPLPPPQAHAEPWVASQATSQTSISPPRHSAIKDSPLPLINTCNQPPCINISHRSPLTTCNQPSLHPPAQPFIAPYRPWLSTPSHASASAHFKPRPSTNALHQLQPASALHRLQAASAAQQIKPELQVTPPQHPPTNLRQQSLCPFRQPSIKHLHNHDVKLVFFGLIKIPSAWGCFTLQHLLANYPVKHVPEDLGSISSLQQLELVGCGLTELPSSFQHLTGVHKLNLQLNSFSSEALEPILQSMSSLQHLDLSSNSLGEVPACLATLSRLTTLRLPRNALTHGFHVLEGLKGLQELFLSHTPVQHFPPSLTKVTSLRTLELCCCGLRSMPSTISALCCLQRLNLSSNDLNSLPAAVGRLTCLLMLNVAHNQLVCLPEALGDLSNLQDLNVSSNILTELPVSVRRLQALKVLNLSRNRLKLLPIGLEDLQNIELLNLEKGFSHIFRSERSLPVQVLVKLKQSNPSLTIQADNNMQLLINVCLRGKMPPLQDDPDDSLMKS